MFQTFQRRNEGLSHKHGVDHPNIFHVFKSWIESKERLRSFLESKSQAESASKPRRVRWWW